MYFQQYSLGSMVDASQFNQTSGASIAIKLNRQEFVTCIKNSQLNSWESMLLSSVSSVGGLFTGKRQKEENFLFLFIFVSIFTIVFSYLSFYLFIFYSLGTSIFLTCIILFWEKLGARFLKFLSCKKSDLK